MAEDGAGDIVGSARTEFVGNEFAEVAVAVDRLGNGPRLRLADLRTGRVRYLDALELETLIWLPEGHLRQLLDPAADRWREDVER
jgi:hypothetical protein